MTLEDTLNQLRTKREGWKEFVAAVDEDLARERIKRLALRRGEIETLVVTGFAQGASIAELKRTYDTKDYRTIKSMLDNNEALLATLAAEEERKTEAEVQGEFTMHGDTLIAIGDAEYNIIDLLDGEYLLDGEGEWDGIVLNDDDRPLAKQILEAINR